MKISISYAENLDISENLIIDHKLGTGKFHVYQAYSPYNRSFYALKIYPKDKLGTSHYHKEKLMFHLNHPNVIQSIPITCNHNNFHAILTEHIKHGDFFDAVTKGFLDSDILIRTYFRQLIEGVEHIHSHGVAHLDLKLENLMLGSNYLLKIIDFDQAQPLSDTCLTSGGSRDYRAPEVLRAYCKDFVAVDIYSLGIILFAFKAREFPFVENDDANKGTYEIYEKNKSTFWKQQADKKERNFYSRDFIELVNGMVHEDANKRFNIKKIKESKWYKGPVLDLDNLKLQMKNKMEPISNIK